MPKISDLPTDTAPAGDDLFPFVDSTASRTEAVTLTNLAASTAFADLYAPFGGVVPSIPPASGEYLTGDAVSSGSFVPTLDRLMVWPIMSPASFTADRIGCWVSTLQASSVTRLGVYANGTDDRPGDLIVDAGTVDCSSTGAKTATISATIPAGLIWVAAAVQVAAGTMALLRFNNTTPRLPTSNATNAIGDKPVIFLRSSVSGALPSSFGAATSTLNNSAPVIALRAA